MINRIIRREFDKCTQRIVAEIVLEDYLLDQNESDPHLAFPVDIAPVDSGRDSLRHIRLVDSVHSDDR